MEKSRKRAAAQTDNQNATRLPGERQARREDASVWQFKMSWIAYLNDALRWTVGTEAQRPQPVRVFREPNGLKGGMAGHQDLFAPGHFCGHAGCFTIRLSALFSKVMPGSIRCQGDAPEGCGSGMRSKW